jgi:prephenate dehydrogenase
MIIPFKHIAIIGLGFMGGSFAKAVQKSQSPLVEFSTFDLDPVGLTGMTKCMSLTEVVSEADLIVLASPLMSYESILKEISEVVKPGALVMDLGSVKAQVNPLMKRHLSQIKNCQWVGGHPMCGSHLSGLQHAKADLFVGATFFLTEGHLEETSGLYKLEALLKSIGAVPNWVNADVHDQVVARTSHLPHLNAAILMHVLDVATENSADLEGEAQTQYMAGGFKDATRIAGANEHIWSDILMSNRKDVFEAIENYERQLTKVKQFLKQEDAEGLKSFLRRARVLRNQIG